MLEASLCKPAFFMLPNIIICVLLSNIMPTSRVFLQVQGTIMQGSFYPSVQRKLLLQRFGIVNTQDGQRATAQFAQDHTVGCWHYQAQNPDF